MQITSQHHTASEIHHQHFLPTSFVGDNIIYKYLDSNLFAVSIANHVSNTITVYVINGISGSIVYTFKEQDVTLDQPIDMLLCENFFILAFKRATLGLPQ